MESVERARCRDSRPPPSTRLCCSARLLNGLNTAGSFPVNGANGTEFSASLYYPRISGRGNRDNHEIFGGAGPRLVKESLLAIATLGLSITSSRAPHFASKHLTSQALHIATLFARRHPGRPVIAQRHRPFGLRSPLTTCEDHAGPPICSATDERTKATVRARTGTAWRLSSPGTP